jgi:hypothetical protein
MTGWAVWGPGKCIADNAAQALKLPGIEAGRFLIWAESSVSKGTGKKFFKPCARLEAVPNTKEFVDWVKGLFARVKAEAVAAATAKENEPQPETVTGSPAPTGTPPAV